MADQDNEKRLDQLLDSLLTTYSDVQPRPGLETRILATVRAQVPQPSRQWRVAWIWAGAVITTLALAAVLLVNYFNQTVPPPPSLARVAQPPSAVHAGGGVARDAMEPPPAVHPNVQTRVLQRGKPQRQPKWTAAALGCAEKPSQAGQILNNSGTAAPGCVLAVVAPDTRQEIFPSPTPLSEQEKLLLGYLAGTPQQEVIAQSRPERPVIDESLEGQPAPEVQPLQHSNSTR